MVDPSFGGDPRRSPHAELVALTLPPVTASVPDARQFVAHALPPTCCADEVSLLVSELASNAVRHANTPFTVSLACDGAIVRVTVEDGDARPPVLRRPTVDAVTGRGLVIVDAIAERWGVDAGASGKSVWFELACRSLADDPAS